MPAIEFKTGRQRRRFASRAVPAGLSGLGKAISGLVASIVRGFLPAPALQPIPVRARAQRRPRI